MLVNIINIMQDNERNEFWKKFYENRDSTGRFVIKSEKTGKTYAIEPIGFTKTGFGDINPATKEVEGGYGDKYVGSVLNEKDSLITLENGFAKIYELGIGESPEGFILDLEKNHGK